MPTDEGVMLEYRASRAIATRTADADDALAASGEGK